MAGGMGPGILSGPVDDPRSSRSPAPEVEASVGLLVTHMETRFTGVVTGFGQGGVILRSRDGSVQRMFALRPGSFLVGAGTVTLVRPEGAAGSVAPPARTASGSLAVARTRARVARAGRILVEGIHDAELVEKVWGDDLRLEGVVVERLDGVDVLPDFVRAFRPGADARLGVLVDHLVPGSKESRMAASVSGPHIAIRGTPYVDVWQAIRPTTLGLDCWPVVPPGRSWKEGMCEAFGEPSPGRLWKKLVAQVHTYADLEPALVGAVEALIDFVTAGA